MGKLSYVQIDETIVSQYSISDVDVYIHLIIVSQKNKEEVWFGR